MRTLQLTVTLAGTCPEAWENIPAVEMKKRAEDVITDMARKVFEQMPVLLVCATATVEGGDHE